MRGVIVFSLLASLFGPVLSSAQYYTFTENSRKSWQEPVEMISMAAKQAANLLAWSLHSAARPEGTEKYNRKMHFGTWIDDPHDDNCYDTRSEVLIRDSAKNVEFYRNNPCKVYSGQWHDPYSGKTFGLATEIEIDHVVALKNAYVSGAWNWPQQLRCLYANFMGYDRHLISASMNENRVKSDKGPEEWMPSDQSYSCQHLHNWMMVKYVWNLNMSKDEALAIQKLFEQYNCNPSEFKPTLSEIAQIRKNIQTDISICQ